MTNLPATVTTGIFYNLAMKPLKIILRKTKKSSCKKNKSQMVPSWKLDRISLPFKGTFESDDFSGLPQDMETLFPLPSEPRIHSLPVGHTALLPAPYLVWQGYLEIGVIFSLQIQGHPATTFRKEGSWWFIPFMEGLMLGRGDCKCISEWVPFIFMIFW